jgi:hypothetical protein
MRQWVGSGERVETCRSTAPSSHDAMRNKHFLAVFTAIACALAFVFAVATALRAEGVAVRASMDTTTSCVPAPPMERLEVTRASPVHVAVAPAPVARRLPAVPPSLGAHVRKPEAAFVVGDGAFSPRDLGLDRLCVRRHVPRMECGDPPRA